MSDKQFENKYQKTVYSIKNLNQRCENIEARLKELEKDALFNEQPNQPDDSKIMEVFEKYDKAILHTNPFTVAHELFNAIKTYAESKEGR